MGQAPHLGGTYIDVVERHVHPDFRADVLGNDIGALLLAQPADVSPIPLWEEEMSAAFVDAEIRLVGFDTEGTIVNKLEGTTKIDAIDSTSFTHHANPAQTCHGDSGGPALTRVGDKELIVGVASSGDDECGELGRHMRVDVYREQFIDSFPRPSQGLGQRCFNNANCISELCVDALEEGAFQYCSAACATSGDCPAAMDCVVDHEGTRLCRPWESPGGARTQLFDRRRLRVRSLRREFQWNNLQRPLLSVERAGVSHGIRV